MTLDRYYRAVLFSAALCVVLTTRVFVQFDSARAKLVTDPVVPVSGVARVEVDPGASTKMLVPPFAVIVRIQNDTAVAEPFTVRIDGQTICAPRVQGGAPRRIDCAWTGDWDRARRHDVDVSSGASVWRLNYLELATHHGATRHYDLIVLPKGSYRYAQLSASWVVTSGLVMAILFLLPSPVMTRAFRNLHRSLSAAIVLGMVLIYASRFVSPFVVLVSRGAFVESVGLLLAPRLWLAARWLWWKQKQPVWRPAVACTASAIVVLGVFGVFASQRLHEYGGNYSGFLQLSRPDVERNPILKDRRDVKRSVLMHENGGYDGEFMYFEAFDPFLRAYKDSPSVYRQFIDAPPYRYGRIGFVLLTKVFSGDRWTLYPATMTWLILVSLFLCGLTLALAARSEGASPAWGMLIILVPGFWQSLQVSLPEPIAAATLLGAYLCLLHGRLGFAGVLFAASLLVRETGIVFVACVTIAIATRGEWKAAARLAAVSVAPVVAWRLYVAWILFPDWGRQAFWFQPDNMGWPLAGIAALWARIRQGEYFPGVPEFARAGVMFPLLLIGGFALALVFAIRKSSAVTVAALLYAAIAISPTYASIWVHIGNAQRGTFEMFVVLALISTGFRRYSRGLQVGLAAFWAFSALYVFFGGFDAPDIRRAVMAFSF